MAAPLEHLLVRLARLTDGRVSRGGDALRRLGRRLATGGGAVLLGLAALAFAKAGDTARALFAQLAAAAPYAPLLTASRGPIIPLFATALLADANSAWVCPTRLYHGLAKPFTSRLARETSDDE